MEAAFFDLDKTVIAKASIAAFGRPFYREGLISRRTVLRTLYAQLIFMHMGASEEKLVRMRDSVLALTRGWHQDHVSSIVEETLNEVVEPIIFREALELIEQHRAEGRKVVIISASPSEIVEPLSNHLKADAAISSKALLDPDGRYTGKMQFYAYGPAKADAIRRMAAEEQIDLDKSFAYSDSATDVPMLEIVGHPVVVNPDRALARTAQLRGWEARRFDHPVRLRDRMPAPRPAHTAIAVGAGFALIGGVWVARKIGRRTHKSS